MITQSELKTLMTYNPKTGTFKWVKSARKLNGSKVGGVREDGYKMVRIGKRIYYLHYLAWLYVYGYYPTKQLTHLNNKKCDNRIANIVYRTNAEILKSSVNPQNVKGVSRDRTRKEWIVTLTVSKNKRIYLGRFKNKQDAINTLLLAREIYL